MAVRRDRENNTGVQTAGIGLTAFSIQYCVLRLQSERLTRVISVTDSLKTSCSRDSTLVSCSWSHDNRLGPDCLTTRQFQESVCCLIRYR